MLGVRSEIFDDNNIVSEEMAWRAKTQTTLPIIIIITMKTFIIKEKN